MEAPKWLKLELLPEASIEATLVILHTHLSSYSYLQELGYTLEFYQDINHNNRQATFFIKTDHDGLYDSCRQFYSRFFNVSRPEAQFKLPAYYTKGLKNDLRINTAFEVA